MDKEEKDDILEENAEGEVIEETPGVVNTSTIHDTGPLRSMFRNWFLDYASYVILDRAVPDLDDGLKPVQRRILHSMYMLDDGRYNKVANIVGNTMQYHPHGDASINDALVTLGQKELLIDTQGNWGNTLTGAPAAAGRYIEARLSPFALETVFSPKITEWTPSYDGRKKEPVALPTKFPLLLYQGVEGIAVGLSSKILPHNFNEIIEAAIKHLKGEDFELLPDFPTGGLLDTSRYNDGRRGGSVKIRARIEKLDNKTLSITEIPYGTTTVSVEESILKAFEKGKIKIRKVEDYTAETANIIVHLIPGTSSDKTIDALYAFTDCEVSVYPNCCVIHGNKPCFLSVKDVLAHNADRARELLGRELEIKRDELREQLFFSTLEKIFIEQRIYKDKDFEEAKDMKTVSVHIRKRMKPFLPEDFRELNDDDIHRLMEIKMARILKFNSAKADEQIVSLKAGITDLDNKLAHLTDYAIKWFRNLQKKYGATYPRRTQLRSFESIEAATVADRNEKLYINRQEGFIGTALKKDEFVCNCSALDDIIIFYRDGRYKVVRVPEKMAVDKNVMHIAVFRKNDKRTVYNAIYQNGKGGTYYMKRFSVTGLARDKEYNFTPGLPGTRVRWFTANPNGEAEIVKVRLKPKPKLKVLQLDVDFSQLAIKGRQSMGNIVTRNEIHEISLKEKGASTLGGRQVWFDPDVLRLNYDGRGNYLGEFQGDDMILVILDNGEYYTTNFNPENHYEENIHLIQKFNPDTVWTAILNDADQGYPYIKRFKFEPTAKRQRYLGENKDSSLILLTSTQGARFELTFAGGDAFRDPVTIDAEDFIGEKSMKARGKRLTAYALSEVKEIEPKPAPEPEESPEEQTAEEESLSPSHEQSNEEIRDEAIGQQRMTFDPE